MSGVCLLGMICCCEGLGWLYCGVCFVYAVCCGWGCEGGCWEGDVVSRMVKDGYDCGW